MVNLLSCRRAVDEPQAQAPRNIDVARPALQCTDQSQSSARQKNIACEQIDVAYDCVFLCSICCCRKSRYYVHGRAVQ